MGLVSDTPTSLPPEKISTTLKSSGSPTGPSTELLTPTIKTAPSLSPTTGRVPNNALNPGSAEVPDSAREVAGAPAMMAAKELLFPTKPPASLLTTDSSPAQ